MKNIITSASRAAFFNPRVLIGFVLCSLGLLLAVGGLSKSATGMVRHEATAKTRGAGLRFEVNSTVDAVDALIGDGICATATGVCTLRAAIQEANAVPGKDVISLPIGTSMLTIPGANEDAAKTGDLDITDDLIIVGSGESQTIIEAAGGFGDRVFHILSGTGGRMSDVSIEHGSAVCCGDGFYWGGGGIYNKGSLSLHFVELAFNSSGFVGGGLYNVGSVKLVSANVHDNSSIYDGGIRNEGKLQFDRGFITQNSVSGGTGAMSNYDTATMTDVTVSNNTSGADTGGVWTLARLTLDRVTFSGNTSQTYGGAVTVLSTGTVTMRNSQSSETRQAMEEASTMMATPRSLTSQSTRTVLP